MRCSIGSPMAGDARRPQTSVQAPSRHGPIAQLLIALSPLSLILIVYAVAGWVTGPLASDLGGTNRLGLALNVTGPPAVDRALFGVIPTVWIQQRLVDGSVHWYDVLAAVVYASHFVAIPLLTAIMWFRWRRRFAGWIAAVITFAVLGVAGYVLYPAAPPWMAAELGVIDEVRRISDIGWSGLNLDVISRGTVSAQGVSNPVAAMPSLHAGSSLLVTLAAWSRLGAIGRVCLSTYVVAMAAALVYTGEHYVVDVLAGWVAAGIAIALATAIAPRRHGG